MAESIEVDRLSDVVGRPLGQMPLITAEARARISIAVSRRWLVIDQAGRFVLTPEGRLYDDHFAEGRP